MKVRVHRARVTIKGGDDVHYENVLLVFFGSDNWLILNFLDGSQIGFPTSSVDRYRLDPPVEVDWPYT